MTVPGAVAHLYDLDAAVALELLETLHDAGMLAKAALTPWEDYYYLTEKAAQAAAVRSEDCRPLAGTSKVTAYAVLHFCCLGGVYRPRITTEAFRTRFRTLYRPGPKINYYTEGKRLGYIRVETSHNTRGSIYRVVERCYKDIRRRTSWQGGSSPAFQGLVASGNFTVALLTPFQTKADRVRQELNRMRERHHQYRLSERKRAQGQYVEHSIHREFLKYQKKGKPPQLPPPLEVHVVPGLLDLIYPKPRG